MSKTSIIALIVGLAALIVVSQSVFIVDQTERAIVLQLGKPVGESSYGAGLHFKLPVVQNVIYFDARILEYDSRPTEILTEDKKAMVVDNYAKWRIAEPLTFYRTVRTQPGAQARLDDIIYAELRVALGRYSLLEVVSKKRTQIMDQVTKKSSSLLKPYGIEVLDVRIKRTDLPPENERAIFGRMKAERQRMAKQYRSEGREAAARITAQADKERSVMLAEADRKSQVLRGEGDGEATKTYADALKQGPAFYEFKRSLEAYEKSLKKNSRVIMTPASPFLQHFN